MQEVEHRGVALRRVVLSAKTQRRELVSAMRTGGGGAGGAADAAAAATVATPEDEQGSKDFADDAAPSAAATESEEWVVDVYKLDEAMREEDYGDVAMVSFCVSPHYHSLTLSHRFMWRHSMTS